MVVGVLDTPLVVLDRATWDPALQRRMVSSFKNHVSWRSHMSASAWRNLPNSTWGGGQLGSGIAVFELIPQTATVSNS